MFWFNRVKNRIEKIKITDMPPKRSKLLKDPPIPEISQVTSNYQFNLNSIHPTLLDDNFF